MKRVLTNQEMKLADDYMINHYHFPNYLLMEQAALGIYYWFTRHFSKKEKILIIYGNGNNGGDGLALARLLSENHYEVGIMPAIELENSHISIQFQLELLKDLPIHFINDNSKTNYRPTVIVDAIFGIGLSRALSDPYIKQINWINKLETTVISIDIPSGLYQSNEEDIAIMATYTLAIGFYKHLHFLIINDKFVGKLHLIEMGINDSRHPLFQNPSCLLLDHEILSFIPNRNHLGHKGTFGTSLLIGGSNSMSGAIVLASLACGKIGVGLTKVITEEEGKLGLIQHFPEAITYSFNFSQQFSFDFLENQKINSICIGPGLGRNNIVLLENIIDYSSKKNIPLLLDADALYILSKQPHLISKLGDNSVITPHLMEMSRLCHKNIDEIKKNPLLICQDFLNYYRGTIVLKDANTYIVSKEVSYIYNGKCPLLATAGSGDVLSGTIGGLLASGLSPIVASALGVYLHGESGHYLKNKFNKYSILAREIISGIQLYLEENKL